MPIPTQTVEVVLQGLDQKTAAILTAPGKLERAQNVEADKAGQLNKRRGFARVAETAADGVDLPDVFHRLAVVHDELLVLSGARAFALVSRSEVLQGETRGFAPRGVMPSGGLSIVNVQTAADTEEGA